jgi:hypothetical protein
MDEVVISTYIYCANTDGSKHRGKRNTYLVEHMGGGKVVARISPMPMVNDSIAIHEAAINGMKSNLVTEGDWSPTARHSRIKVHPRKVTKSATPKQPKP